MVHITKIKLFENPYYDLGVHSCRKWRVQTVRVPNIFLETTWSLNLGLIKSNSD